jgi:hypothetical protein
MVLIGVVAFIENQEVNALDLDEAMHKEIVEFLRHDDHDILTRHFIPPLQRVRIISSLLLAAVVATHIQVGVPVNRVGLLLNQVLRWDDEYRLFLFIDPFFVVSLAQTVCVYLVIDSPSLLLRHLALRQRAKVQLFLRVFFNSLCGHHLLRAVGFLHDLVWAVRLRNRGGQGRTD